MPADTPPSRTTRPAAWRRRRLTRARSGSIRAENAPARPESRPISCLLACLANRQQRNRRRRRPFSVVSNQPGVARFHQSRARGASLAERPGDPRIRRAGVPASHGPDAVCADLEPVAGPMTSKTPRATAEPRLLRKRGKIAVRLGGPSPSQRRTRRCCRGRLRCRRWCRGSISAGSCR